MPGSVRSKTKAEQLDFIRKSLQDEISLEGFDVLRKRAIYGSLKQIFPNEAKAWSEQAGVKPEDCVAFKLERNGQRAEVVLAKTSSIEHPESSIAPMYRIVRCNNVKQLATKL